MLGKLLIADTNGRHKRTLWKYQGGGSAPAWNPAGTEIAVTLVPNTSRDGSLYPDAVKGGLWIVPVKGGRHHLIAPAAQGSVAWSPNGGSLVYTTGLPTGAVRIRTISAKGGPYRQIATISPDSQNDSVNVSVAWSPNGKNILIDSYQQLLGGNYGVGHSKVQQVPSTGGALQTLLPNNPLAFYMGAMYSPDGKKIAMVTVSVAPPGSTTTIPYIQYWTLNTLNVNGSDLQTITGLSNHAQLLGWVKAFKS